jgi:hypothetical protein
MGDVIVRNARVITMNPRRPSAEALSIRRGLIQSIGGLDEVMSHRARATRLLDLEGRYVIPGLIGQSLPKDAADLIDWIEVEPAGVVGEEMDCFLSSRLDSVRGRPFAVSLLCGPGPVAYRLLTLLADLAYAPIAVRVAGEAECFVDLRMAELVSRLGHEMEIPGTLRAGYVGRASISAVACALASSGRESRSARMIDKAIARCVRSGFVAVRDRSLGALTGMAELEAAVKLAGRARLRIRGVTHERLRERANQRTLRPGYGDDMFRVDAASIEFPSKKALAAVQAEVVSLEAQGWRVEFAVRNSAGLAQAIAVEHSRGCQGKRRTVFVSQQLNQVEVAKLRRINLFPVWDRAPLAPVTRALDLEDGLRPLTVDAARQCGLRGRLDVGAPADLTILERFPAVAETGTDVPGILTWVEGVPVHPSAG